MTHMERTPEGSARGTKGLTWAFFGFGLVALVAVAALGFTGHPEAATAAGMIGAAAWAAGGLSITVTLRR